MVANFDPTPARFVIRATSVHKRVQKSNECI